MDARQLATDLIAHYNFLDLPIGVYVVAPDGRFLACNRPVRELLHLPRDGDVNATLAQFYADPKSRAEILQKANDAEARGGYLEKEIIPFRVDGREIFVEDYCKPLRDARTRDLVGYIGCLVDITAEHIAEKRESKLQHQVEELTFDIGRVLHANTSTLLMAQQTLDGVAEALSQRALRDTMAIPLDELDDQLIKHAEQLASALEKLLQSSDPERRLKALSETQWENLATKIEPLRAVRDFIPGMEMRVPALRSTAHQITLTCLEIAPGILSKELTREALRASTQVESSACLIDVLMTRTAIIQMDATLRSLRDFITSEVRTHEQAKRMAVKSLVEHSIKQMAEFAKSSRVAIVWRERDFEGAVEGIERDLARALTNLLHNAIKYSWRRDRAKAPWVTVRTYARDEMACIEFENWGVPIAPEEIEQGLIFQLGYRGKWSKDRGRLGTGIGLTDAKRAAQAHHGDLQVASRPSVSGAHQPEHAEYFHQPFITTVTFCLPLLGRR